MKEIDMDKLWAGAPKEATHYDCREFISPAFMRKNHNGRDWEFFGDKHWVMYGQLGADQAAKIIARPTPWSGDGLPPVGIDFEWRYGDHAWKSGRALYIGSVYAILAASDFEQHYYLRDMQFRPIRTPEQIAAEEREAAVKKMLADGGQDDVLYELDCKDMAERLYDAGYRKFEITDES